VLPGTVASVVPNAKGKLSIGQCRSKSGSASPHATIASTPGSPRSNRIRDTGASMSLPDRIDGNIVASHLLGNHRLKIQAVGTS
jgi:hypothetical protein